MSFKTASFKLCPILISKQKEAELILREGNQVAMAEGEEVISKNTCLVSAHISTADIRTHLIAALVRDILKMMRGVSLVHKKGRVIVNLSSSN